MAMSGASPQTSWATIRPVPGPSVRPVIEWPAAMVTLRQRDDGPMIGTPSGVTGRIPAHRRRTTNESSRRSRRRAIASSRVIRSSRHRRVEVVELEPGAQAQLVAHRADGDVVLTEQQRPTRADVGAFDRQAQASAGEHRHPLTEKPGEAPRPCSRGEHDVGGADVAAGRPHADDPVTIDVDVDHLGERHQPRACPVDALDQVGERSARMDAAVVREQDAPGDRSAAAPAPSPSPGRRRRRRRRHPSGAAPRRAGRRVRTPWLRRRRRTTRRSSTG